MSQFDDAIAKIANKINQKRRQELLWYFSEQSSVSDYVGRAKREGIFKKGSTSKTLRKIAEMPLEVDLFFTRIYGPEYHKDKNFFKKFPEWLVVDDP